MNDPAALELVDIINDEIRVFQELLELLQEEQEAIVNNDLAGIEAAVAAKQRTVQEAQLLEGRRAQVVRALSRRLERSEAPASLAQLVELLEDDDGEELRQMREVLLDLNGRIRAASDSNAFLVRQSLRYTDRCIDILTGPKPTAGTYGQFGRQRRAAHRSVLNRTA